MYIDTVVMYRILCPRGSTEYASVCLPSFSSVWGLTLIFQPGYSRMVVPRLPSYIDMFGPNGAGPTGSDSRDSPDIEYSQQSIYAHFGKRPTASRQRQHRVPADAHQCWTACGPRGERRLSRGYQGPMHDKEHSRSLMAAEFSRILRSNVRILISVKQVLENGRSL
jgi:hypothetical protein